MILTAETLLRAYSVGVFPMAEDRNDPELFWVNPEMRGILPLADFHLPRSLKKTIKQGVFEITSDKAFERIMRLCAEPAPDRPGTWINDPILDLFAELHKMGYAHSVEVWKDGVLAGGLYGLAIGGAFFGESMVSRATDASKTALAALAAILKLNGFVLLDTQFITDHLSRFGAIEIPRTLYQKKLQRALKTKASFDHPNNLDILAALAV